MNHLDFNGLKIASDFWDGWKIFMMGDYLYQAFKDPISLKADRSQVSSHPYCSFLHSQ